MVRLVVRPVANREIDTRTYFLIYSRSFHINHSFFAIDSMCRCDSGASTELLYRFYRSALVIHVDHFAESVARKLF